MEETIGGIGMGVIAIDVDKGARPTHHVAHGLASLADDEAHRVARDRDGNGERRGGGCGGGGYGWWRGGRRGGGGVRGVRSHC